LAFEDLRSFLTALEEAGELKRISREVKTEFEIAAYIRKASDVGGPAFLFENVRGFPGWRVTGGLYGTLARAGIAFGCPVGQVVDEYERVVKNPIEPTLVRSGPVQEVLLTGDEVDLTQLPICVHSEKDSGPYITVGVAIGRDPDSGVNGMAICRHELKGPRRLGINNPPERRLGRYFLKAESQGNPLEIAIVIGGGPAIDLASQAKVGHDVDKLNVAGGMLGRPVEVVRCKTVDLNVPARAEIVIEGRILPNVREEEGPFGEVAGTYGSRGMRAVVEVTAITRRRDAIYQTALTGMPTTENHVMAWPSIAESARRIARQACPEVTDVHVIGPYYMVVVAIKRRLAHEARNVILSVLGATAGAPMAKYCIVVDDDIDVRNIEQVLWAMYTRVQPERDMMIFPTMVGAPLDPSAPLWRHTSKVGIDATVPYDAEPGQYDPVVVPGTDDVDWED
jgi:2,5-furandicarboxylate decarboxylase 1